MKLIVGLGNPGKKYDNTWHNLGFAALGELRVALGLPAFKKSERFKADTSEGLFGREKIILAKPQTYMNNSGESVRALAAFYRIKPADIIVVHDDIDLPLGKIRLSKDSSAGGHNGIKSIIEMLGSKGFMRVRIGVGTPLLAKIDAADYVLAVPSKKDRPAAEKQCQEAANAAKDILEIGLDKAMNKWN